MDDDGATTTKNVFCYQKSAETLPPNEACKRPSTAFFSCRIESWHSNLTEPPLSTVVLVLVRYGRSKDDRLQRLGLLTPDDRNYNTHRLVVQVPNWILKIGACRFFFFYSIQSISLVGGCSGDSSSSRGSVRGSSSEATTMLL